MNAIFFKYEYSPTLCCRETVTALHPNVRALLVKFALTDINIRRRYSTLTIE